MAKEGAGTPREPPRAYDADTRLLAFLGTLSLIIGSVFWVLVGMRLQFGLLEPPPAHGDLTVAAAFALGPAGALASLAAWGLRTRLQHGEPVSTWSVRAMLAAGLVIGVVIGFVIFVALAYKLRDPGFMHLAGEPGRDRAGAR